MIRFTEDMVAKERANGKEAEGVVFQWHGFPPFIPETRTATDYCRIMLRNFLYKVNSSNSKNGECFFVGYHCDVIMSIIHLVR